MTIRRLLNDRVLIKRTKPEEMSKGGIHLPGNAQEKQSEGTVLAVGPGRLNDRGQFIETTLKVGDLVLFMKYTGEPLNGDMDQIFVREDDVLAVLEP